jgi:PAS domain S-box-containing protein
MSLAIHRHGNAWLGDLIEHISDSTVLTTAQGMITYANPSAQRNTGYSAAELQGMHSLDLVHPEDLADCRRQMEKLLSKPGVSVTYELRLRHKNGSWRRMEVVAIDLLSDPQVEAIVGIYRDSAELHRASATTTARTQPQAAGEQIQGSFIHTAGPDSRIAAPQPQPAIPTYSGGERSAAAFTSMLNHELRTPLTAIQGLVELALLYCEQRPTPLSRKAKDLVKAIEKVLELSLQQVDVEISVVEALIDLSQLEQNTLKLVLADCDLYALVEEVVANQRQAAHPRRIELVLSSDVPVCVFADAQRIRQALLNYLSNALTHSAVEQPLIVQLAVEAGWTRVSIRSQRPGPAHEQPGAGKQSYQAQAPMSLRTEGGLLLAVAQAIVQQHRGQTGIEGGPAQSTTFWFALPLAGAAAPG